MLALNTSGDRQKRLWLPGLALPTVLAVEDSAAKAYKRSFASNLVVMRANSGLGSQREVAKLVGTSEATYRRWEDVADAAFPDAYEIFQMCSAKIFGCDPAELINPEPLSDREVLLARRLARATRAGQRRGQRGES